MYRRALFFSLILFYQFVAGNAWAEKQHAQDETKAQSASEPAAGTLWTETSTGIEFVWVPSGCFKMGGDKYQNEQPAHKVYVKGFWMGRYEITQAQYQQVMGNNPSKFQALNNPIENVTWDDAMDFVEEMGFITGTKVRLPSEAEWEYACRAGGAHRKYCGPGLNPGKIAWFKGNSKETIHPVGKLAPNDWGLFDMSGNAEEWTQDCEHGDYKGAPTNGDAWLSKDYDDHKDLPTLNSKPMAGVCDWHMLRGGAWRDESTNHLRAASRSIGFANNHEISSGGFRIVRTQAE